MEIPLFKPSLPDYETWLPWYLGSERTGKLTNFGSIHEAVVKNLQLEYGGFWLPVCNGTVALEAALQTLPDEVETVGVPDFTFAASAFAILRTGRTPVLLPCGKDMAPYARPVIENLDKIDALMLVSPFGYRVPTNFHLAKEFRALNRPVIWDNAGAFPEFDVDAPTCFSLHAAKSMPIGEGGLVRFPDEKSRDLARARISFDFDASKDAQSLWGFNGKMDELHSAVLLGQLAQLQKVMGRITKRIITIRAYERALSDFCDPWPSEALAGSPSICVLRLPHTDEIVIEGARRGITFRKYYHPFLSDMKGFADLPRITGSNHAALSKCLALPSDVTDSEFKAVIECVREVLEGKRDEKVNGA